MKEEIEKLLVEARQVAVASPILFPMLERRKTSSLQKLLSTYRDGGVDYLPIIAELFVIETMRQELEAKLEYLNLKENK